MPDGAHWVHEDGDVAVMTLQLTMSRAYLIRGPAGLVLVDAGLRGEASRVLRALQSLGRDDLRAIFITHAHFDHYGSAAALRRATGAPIAIHRDDADAMARGDTPVVEGRGWGIVGRWLLPFAEFFLSGEPASADIVLDDGAPLDGLGVETRVLHTPGHTAGSSCLLVDKRYAFVGDLLSAGRQARPQRLFFSDQTQMAGSLARLRDARPEWIFAGHGKRALPGAAL